jgi:hypothetical protein
MSISFPDEAQFPPRFSWPTMRLFSDAASLAGRSAERFLEKNSVPQEQRSWETRGWRRDELSWLIREEGREGGNRCLQLLSRKHILLRDKRVSYSHGWWIWRKECEDTPTLWNYLTWIIFIRNKESSLPWARINGTAARGSSEWPCIAITAILQLGNVSIIFSKDVDDKKWALIYSLRQRHRFGNSLTTILALNKDL